MVHNPRTAAGDVRTQRAYDGLPDLGGQDQRPFPVDRRRGERLCESDAIVDYLHTHYSRDGR